MARLGQPTAMAADGPTVLGHAGLTIGALSLNAGVGRRTRPLVPQVTGARAPALGDGLRTGSFRPFVDERGRAAGRRTRRARQSPVSARAREARSSAARVGAVMAAG